MSKASTKVPLPPREVDFWLAVKLRRQGKKDAKRYAQFNDVTRTHAIVEAQNKAISGQRSVNRWLIQQTQPLLVGNARAQVVLETYESEMARLNSSETTKSRSDKHNESRRDTLVREIMNLQGQFESNLTQIVSLKLTAREAVGSWKNYYEQMAAIYTRARANKSRINPDSVKAEVPELDEIDGVDFAQIEQNFTVNSSVN